MKTVAKYIIELQQAGRYHFTTKEAQDAVGGQPSAVVRALHRQKQKGQLASPQRGFYLVVPPEYQILGCLPAEQFIPQLMDFNNEPYHVALLSAAQLHGAAHQKPQRFQVMVQSPRKAIACGKIAVDFFVRSQLESVSTITINTPRGILSVSSPEATALELVGYQKQAGGLDNVATVLYELSENISPDKLLAETQHAPLAWGQRLGYLLELVEQHEVATELVHFVRDRAQRVTALDASVPRTGAKRSTRWKVAINVEVEPDL